MHRLHPIVARTNTYSRVQKLINYCFSVELVCLKHTGEYPPVAYTVSICVCTMYSKLLYYSCKATKKKSSEGVE